MTIDLCKFNSLVNEYQKRFIRFAIFYVRDEMYAEDIVMESFMYYWENRHKLPSDTNVPAYILTTVKHKCIDHLRSLQSRQDISGEAEQLDFWELSSRIVTLENFEPSEIFTSEIETLVKKTLDSLPEQTRKIFILSRYENKSYNEISMIYGITPKGVEFHISKAIKALRKSLKDYLPFWALYFYI